jgi:hypothetical protein
MTMHGPSRLQFAAIAIVALPGWAASQSSASATVGVGATVGSPQLAASPIVAPVTLDLSVGDGSIGLGSSALPTPAADLSAEPIAVASAEGSASTPVGTADGTAGPRLATATSGIRANTAKEDLTAQQAADRAAHHAGFGTDGALMIVGGAAFIAGLIIGGGAGTAIAIGGAVIGLYGLYLYLQ